MFRVRRLLPVSADFIEGIKRAAFAGDDVIGGLAPGEGLRLCIVQQKVVVDGALEIVDAGVAPSADALRGDLGKEALDQVQPGRAGGREVKLEARVCLQPGSDLGGLVGGVVVEHDVDVAGFEDGAVDAA